MEYEPVTPRARLGFILPSSNRMLEPQIQRFTPDGVVPHFTRIGMTGRHAAPLAELMPRIALAAEWLGDAKCDVVVLQCTGTSMSGGLDMEKEVIRTMERASGRAALTTASSLMAALGALGANRLVFISESDQAGHDRKPGFLDEAGFDIVADKAMCLQGSDAYCTTPPEFWFESVREMKHDAAEAYFISCANIHGIDVIEELEAELGKPVVTSNQVALWCALRAAGIKDAVPGLGGLFRIEEAAAAAAE